MYQQQFKPTPLFGFLVEPFIERLPKQPGERLMIVYPRTRTVSSVRQQWYNWIHHHARGLYRVSHEPMARDYHWKLIITRVMEEEAPKEVK